MNPSHTFSFLALVLTLFFMNYSSQPTFSSDEQVYSWLQKTLGASSSNKATLFDSLVNHLLNREILLVSLDQFRFLLLKEKDKEKKKRDFSTRSLPPKFSKAPQL